jgi:hypothetical protein
MSVVVFLCDVKLTDNVKACVFQMWFQGTLVGLKSRLTVSQNSIFLIELFLYLH